MQNKPKRKSKKWEEEGEGGKAKRQNFPLPLNKLSLFVAKLRVWVCNCVCVCVGCVLGVCVCMCWVCVCVFYECWQQQQQEALGKHITKTRLSRMCALWACVAFSPPSLPFPHPPLTPPPPLCTFVCVLWDCVCHISVDISTQNLAKFSFFFFLLFYFWAFLSFSWPTKVFKHLTFIRCACQLFHLQCTDYRVCDKQQQRVHCSSGRVIKTFCATTFRFAITNSA